MRLISGSVVPLPPPPNVPFKGPVGFHNRVPFQGSCKVYGFRVYLKAFPESPIPLNSGIYRKSK